MRRGVSRRPGYPAAGAGFTQDGGFVGGAEPACTGRILRSDDRSGYSGWLRIGRGPAVSREALSLTGVGCVGQPFFASEEEWADPQETPRFRRGPKQCVGLVGFLG